MTKKPQQGFLAWKAPDRALGVRLDHNVIERMTVDIMRGFGVTRRRGTEVGGVLLGKISAGDEPLVLVYDYETVPCEYSEGPSYVLSERDLQAFNVAVRQWQREISPDQYAVGYFRSHTRDGLYLDEKDAQVFHRYLKDPLAIALVIKPYATRPSEAAFFLQSAGRVESQPTPPEFQFVRAESAVPKDAGRFAAQPAPVSTRYAEEDEPEDEIATADEPAADDEYGEMVDARPVEPPAPITQSPTLLHAVEAEQARPVADSPVPERPAGAMFGTYYPPQPQRSWRRRALWASYTLAVFGFGSVVGFEYAGGEIRRFVAAPQQRPADPYNVHLAAVEQDQNVLVHWNRDSEAVKTALNGVLTITEGAASKEVKLDFPELRNGTVLYHRVGQQVGLKLDLYFKENRVFTESVTLRFPER